MSRLLNHTMPTWLFAEAIGRMKEMDYDREVVAVGTVRHDISLVMLHFSAAPIEQVGWRWLWKRCFGAVSAFSTIPSEVFFDVFDAKKRRTRRRPSLVYCGDDQDAKAVAATLIRDVGFDPADAGRLRIARYLEAFALAMAQLAYEGRDRVPYRALKSRAQ